MEFKGRLESLESMKGNVGSTGVDTVGLTFMQANLKSNQKNSWEQSQVEGTQAVLSFSLVLLCRGPSDAVLSFLSNL